MADPNFIVPFDPNQPEPLPPGIPVPNPPNFGQPVLMNDGTYCYEQDVILCDFLGQCATKPSPDINPDAFYQLIETIEAISNTQVAILSQIESNLQSIMLSTQNYQSQILLGIQSKVESIEQDFIHLQNEVYNSVNSVLAPIISNVESVHNEIININNAAANPIQVPAPLQPMPIIEPVPEPEIPKPPELLPIVEPEPVEPEPLEPPIVEPEPEPVEPLEPISTPKGDECGDDYDKKLGGDLYRVTSSCGKQPLIDFVTDQGLIVPDELNWGTMEEMRVFIRNHIKSSPIPPQEDGSDNFIIPLILE
jgi:hypothetical protein